MKNKIFLIALVAIILSGCEDFLDRKPLGQQTTESFFGDPKTAEDNFETMIHACYSVFYMSENSWGQHNHHGEWMFGDWLSDDCEKGGNGASDFPEVLDWRTWNTVPTSQGHENNAWRCGYLGVARANAVIQLIDKYKENLSEATYNRIKGEALFNRGYFYFYLAKVYGSVPYFDAPVLPDQYNDQPKVSPEKLYAYIEQDLTEAASLLPVKSSWSDASPIGRATKGSAQAILARVLTMEIGFGFNGKTWQEVHDITKSIISSGEYQLVSNYATIFEMEGEESSEMVFEIICEDVNQAYGAPGGNLQPRMVTFRPDPALNADRNLSTGGWGFSCPSEDLYNEFEDGDVRRACTIIEDGAILWADGDSTTNEQINTIENDDCPTGYWVRKYAHSPDNTPSANTNSGINMRKVRYAEVLLTCAEAAYYIGAEDEARQYIKQIRDRANNSTLPLGSELENTGYPANPNPAALAQVTASGDALLNAIKHERRVELAIEGNRAWDLIRWGDYEDALKNSIIPDDHFLSEVDIEQVITNYRSHLIDGKVPCLPIPPDEIIQYGIIQNPGY